MEYICRYNDTHTHIPLQWHHNEHDGISNHQHNDCLLKRLFRHRSKKTSKLPVTGLFVGNSPLIGEFPTQRAGNAENVSIWWRHHDIVIYRQPISWTTAVVVVLQIAVVGCVQCSWPQAFTLELIFAFCSCTKDTYSNTYHIIISVSGY